MRLRARTIDGGANDTRGAPLCGRWRWRAHSFFSRRGARRSHALRPPRRAALDGKRRASGAFEEHAVACRAPAHRSGAPLPRACAREARQQRTAAGARSSDSVRGARAHVFRARWQPRAPWRGSVGGSWRGGAADHRARDGGSDRCVQQTGPRADKLQMRGRARQKRVVRFGFFSETRGEGRAA